MTPGEAFSSAPPLWGPETQPSALNSGLYLPPRLVYLFSWEPGGPVTVSEHRDAPHAFLPPWYVEAVTQDLPSPPKTPSPKD